MVCYEDDMVVGVFFFKQKTAYEMRISDWSSDVCSSDLARDPAGDRPHRAVRRGQGRLPGDGGGRAFRQDRDRGLKRVAPPAAKSRGNVDILAETAILSGIMIEEDIGHAEGQIGRASCRERVCRYV